jgi:hypothetical protein
LLLEALESPLEEALPPLADDLARSVEARRDFIIPQALCREEDDLGSNYISVR